MVPPLRPAQALGFYQALLADAAERLRAWQRASLPGEVCLDGRPGDGEIAAWRLHDLPLTDQGDGDLGDRLSRACRRLASEGVRSAVFMGTDAPTLPDACVVTAFRRLEQGAEAVVCAAGDGGYVLIGVRPPQDVLFRWIDWGSDVVLRQTQQRAAAAGLVLEVLPGWHDVDDAAGLERLRRELARPEYAALAPATAAWLRAAAGMDAAPPGVV